MFFDRFKELCQEKGVSVYKACTDIGLNRSAVNKWKQGGQPNGTTLACFAKYFGVSVDYLVGNVSDPAFHLDTGRNMSVLYKRIEELCSENGETITSMCKASGASRASLSDLKVGRKQSLSAETLSKIAAHFNVSVDYLLSGCYRSSCTAYPNGITVFYDKFVLLCTLKGVSPSKAAVDAGISKSLVTKWKVNGVDVPSPEILKKLSTYFGVPVSRLLSEEEQKTPTLTEKDERNIARDNEGILIRAFSKLNEEGQQAGIKHIELLTKIDEYKKHSHTEALKFSREYTNSNLRVASPVMIPGKDGPIEKK